MSLKLSHVVERGMLTLSRVQNLKHNFAIVDALTEIATRKGITPAQLSIAWVSARGPHVVPLPGSSCVLIISLMPSTLLTQAIEMRSEH
jgi:aryl-alcohol dehydrogenase-like predicted oxidoreductase